MRWNVISFFVLYIISCVGRYIFRQHSFTLLKPCSKVESVLLYILDLINIKARSSLSHAFKDYILCKAGQLYFSLFASDCISIKSIFMKNSMILSQQSFTNNSSCYLQLIHTKRYRKQISVFFNSSVPCNIFSFDNRFSRWFCSESNAFI